MADVQQTLSDSSLSTTASANFEDPLALGKQLVELIGRLIDEADPKAEKVCVEFGLTAFFNDPKNSPTRQRDPNVSAVKQTKPTKAIKQPTKSVTSTPPKSLKSLKSLKSASPGSLTSRNTNKLVECRMSSDTHNIATDGTEDLIKTKSTGGGYRDGYFIDVNSEGSDKSNREKRTAAKSGDSGKCRFVDVKMDSDELAELPDSNDDSSVEKKKPSRKSSKKRSSRRSSKSRSGKGSNQRSSQREESKKSAKPNSCEKRQRSPDGENNCANYYD
uniref:Protein CUSTOS n=1 Tax=Panagrellus redivivus TaxID=6233 RepID=A0A7E4USM1_PANRE